MLRVREQHKESLISQEELLNEMEAVNRMTEREKKVEEDKRKMREKELQTQVSIMFVGQDCCLAVIKPISGCVRTACSGLMLTSLLHVVNKLDAS